MSTDTGAGTGSSTGSESLGMAGLCTGHGYETMGSPTVQLWVWAQNLGPVYEYG